MIQSIKTSLLFAVFGILFTLDSDAASSIFSNYGQIQNVQNYSSSPFWNPNSPYNGTIPRPVYAQGTDLKTNDCITVVQSLVSVQCMVRDNCKNTKLSEIRPEIMIQLSKLPNHNYVSACAGFIDSVYEKYVEQYANTVASGTVAFPTGTTPNTKLNTNTTQIENPYKQKTPQWKSEIQERTNEIESLEHQMGGGNSGLTATAFPTTYADFSFTERMANDAAGLEPYKDLKAYKTLNVKTADEWCSDNEHRNSPECREYRNCTDIAHASDGNVTLAEYTDDRICQVKDCVSGYTPNKNKNACIRNQGTDCLSEMTANNSNFNISAAKINDNGICEVTACKQGWHVNDAKTGCDKTTNTTNNNNNETEPREGEHRSFIIS